MWQSIENELAAADQDVDRGSLDAMQDFQLHWKAVKLRIAPLWHANPQAPWVIKSQILGRVRDDLSGRCCRLVPRQSAPPEI